MFPKKKVLQKMHVRPELQYNHLALGKKSSSKSMLILER